MTWFVVGCLLSAAIVSAAATAVVKRVVPRLGLMDEPDAVAEGGRKDHRQITPLGGGIAIWLGVVVPAAAATGLAAFYGTADPASLPGWIPEPLRPHLPGAVARAGEFWSLVAAASVLAAMGLWDDFRSLPWQPRLVGQIAVAAFIVFGLDIHATLFVDSPLVGRLATVAWIFVLVNALNFLDNMDGLTAGIAVVAAGVFAGLMLGATAEPRWLVAGAMLVLAGSALGFLVHNRPPASIFMGDAGSYFIGCLLATLTVSGTFYDGSTDSPHVLLSPLFVLAIPLYDFATIMFIRLKEGRSPWVGDASHFSHRLVELGLSRPATVLTIHLCTLVTGLGAVLLYAVDSWRGASIVCALIAAVLALVTVLETAGRRSKREPR